MMDAMNHERGSAAPTAAHWSTCSECFLEAAGHLPPGKNQMGLPRLQLMCTALQYRLKAFICAARGGAPGTGDLSRLASLAIHCGLSLTRPELESLAALDRAHAGGGNPETAPDLERVHSLCSSISAQMFGQP